MFTANETTVGYQCREVENDGLDIQIAGKSRFLVRFENKILDQFILMGKTITTYLIDGTPQGARMANVSNKGAVQMAG